MLSHLYVSTSVAAIGWYMIALYLASTPPRTLIGKAAMHMHAKFMLNVSMEGYTKGMLSRSGSWHMERYFWSFFLSTATSLLTMASSGSFGSVNTELAAGSCLGLSKTDSTT